MRIIDIILNENATIDELKELLDSDFSEAYEQYKKGFKIYKGFEEGEPDRFGVMNPKQNRPSRNTVNFYNPIINEAPWWKEFPDRNVICTTDGEYADSFGKVYFIFPENASRIGICPGSDIWNSKSFNTPILDPDIDYIDIMTEISELLLEDSREGFKNYEHLVKNVHEFDNLDQDQKIDHITGLKVLEEIIDDIVNDGLFNFIKTYFTPNNFDLKTISNFNYNHKDDREVWFNNKFLAVEEDKMIDWGL